MNTNGYHMVSDWLEQKFLHWQLEQGRSTTVKEFANYLGVEYSLFVKHFRGTRQPGIEYIAIYAEKLNDKTIYDIAGYKRPDPLLDRLREIYDEIPPENRSAAIKEVLKLIKENYVDPYRKE